MAKPSKNKFMQAMSHDPEHLKGMGGPGREVTRGFPEKKKKHSQFAKALNKKSFRK
jgi:hypothetical protein